MKFKIFVLLNILAAFCLRAADTAAVIIKQGDIYVSSDKIYLGDIADFRDTAAPDGEKLKSIYIKKSAVPGFKTAVEKEFIEARVRKYFKDMAVEGPETVSVYTSKASVSRADIEKAASDYISSNIPWQSGSYEINVRRAKGSISVPSGEIDVRVKQGQTFSYKGIMNVQVEIYVDNVLYKTEPVSISVKVAAPCAVAAVDFPRQSTVYPEGITMEVKDITYLPDNIITDPAVLYKRVTSRAIMKGAVLTTEMFDSAPVFKRGAAVDVIVKVKSVVVQTEGTALADGREGDTVGVRLKSGKSVTGKVDESGKVLIEK
jgi:flagella basal body P-ring formation protein FlgA